MTEEEKERAAFARSVHLRLGSFVLLDYRALFGRREEVIEEARPAELLGGRSARLVAQLMSDKRPARFARHCHELRRCLKNVSSPGKATPRACESRLSPHQQQLQAH